MQIVRFRSTTGETVVGVSEHRQGAAGNVMCQLGTDLSDLLRLPLAQLRMRVEAATLSSAAPLQAGQRLAPVDGGTEVWAAGVTYKRSEAARMQESGTPDIYAQVYRAERPEFFFKANARRVADPNGPVVVRADSTWDVPEPELTLVINAGGEIVGYTIGNDMSSRSIEGANPLYLPQAKVYAGCCAMGPGITPSWEIADPYHLAIHMQIERNARVVWEGETNTAELKRRFEDLVAYLFREDDFPDGVLLCTGTALVPDPPFTLEGGDTVQITIDELGTLRNRVVRGKAGLRQSLEPSQEVVK